MTIRPLRPIEHPSMLESGDAMATFMEKLASMIRQTVREEMERELGSDEPIRKARAVQPNDDSDDFDGIASDKVYRHTLNRLAERAKRRSRRDVAPSKAYARNYKGRM